MAAENTRPERLGLRQQVLLAALECSGGSPDTSFTAEDLLLAAWKRDPSAWGLRGHEHEHPDSERIYVEIDRAAKVKGGLVGLGLFEKVRQRTYRLTPKGLSEAAALVAGDSAATARAERGLADAISAILSHSVFRDWIRDPKLPKHFRDAGHFWGIAPGTPPSVIRSRVAEIDHTLQAALARLEHGGATEVSARHGKVLFDRQDVQRALEFHASLKERFKGDLATLGVEI